MDIVRTLRWVSLAEATSFLLLLVASAVKYGAELPQGVQVLGPLHGMLFIAYTGLVVMARPQTGWDLRRTALALIAGVLPAAPYLVERRWLSDTARQGGDTAQRKSAALSEQR